MGINVDFVKEDGRIVKIEIGPEGFMDKKEFKELLEVVKRLDERKFDPVLSTWVAPLTTDNFKTIDIVLSKEQREKLEEELQ